MTTAIIYFPDSDTKNKAQKLARLLGDSFSHMVVELIERELKNNASLLEQLENINEQAKTRILEPK